MHGEGRFDSGKTQRCVFSSPPFFFFFDIFEAVTFGSVRVSHPFFFSLSHRCKAPVDAVACVVFFLLSPHESSPHPALRTCGGQKRLSDLSESVSFSLYHWLGCVLVAAAALFVFLLRSTTSPRSLLDPAALVYVCVRAGGRGRGDAHSSFFHLGAARVKAKEKKVAASCFVTLAHSYFRTYIHVKNLMRRHAHHSLLLKLYRQERQSNNGTKTVACTFLSLFFLLQKNRCDRNVLMRISSCVYLRVSFFFLFVLHAETRSFSLPLTWACQRRWDCRSTPHVESSTDKHRFLAFYSFFFLAF